MWLSCLITTLSFSNLVQGSEYFTIYGKDSFQTYSCVEYLSSIATFCETSSSKFKKRHGSSTACYCTNENAIASVVGCMNDIGKKTTAGLRYYIKYCDDLSAVLTMNEIEEAFELYQNNASYTSDIANFSSSTVVGCPIKLNVTTAKHYYLSEKIFLGNFDLSVYYGAGSVAFWFFVALIAMIANWALVIFPSLRMTMNGPISKCWRKYVTLPALARKKRNEHQKLFGILNFLVPSRIESLIVFVFFWMTFAFCTHQIKFISNDPLFAGDVMALWRIIAVRTGVIATFLFPLLFLLAGRNNFLQWLTRWKYSTFIMYHRWIARIDVALVLIHTMLYFAIFTLLDRMTYQMAQRFVQYGVLAWVCGVIFCFQGLLYLRRKFYEFFLVIHIILAVGWLVGCWIHLVDLGYWQYVTAGIAIWCFDRFVRIVRLLVFGFQKAQVSLVEGEILRIVVPKPGYWRAPPGGHVWIHICSGWSFWQSHPFTFFEATNDENQIVFLCKVKKGVTKTFADKLSNLPGRTLTCRVGVEGPYGESSPVQTHSNVVFLAGGTGIPGIFSEVFTLAKRSAIYSKQNLKLIWIIREAKSVAWIFEELQSLKFTSILTTIYITKPESSESQELNSKLNDISETSGSEKQDLEVLNFDNKTSEFQNGLIAKLKETFPHIEFKLGRPVIDAIVQQEIEETSKSVAFVSCGHPAMVDETRASIVQRLDKTVKRVDFFEQLQIWT